MADHLQLTAQIVASYLASAKVDSTSVPRLIRGVYEALASAGKAPQPLRRPAVPIGQSVRRDYLICLEDGKKLKILRSHLQKAFGMTPSQYRQKWGLPPDYPMVARAYSAQRSRLAKSFGLGKRPAAPAPPTVTKIEAGVSGTKRSPGRPRKRPEQR